MQKSLKICFVLFFLCTGQKLVALYFGNPSSPIMPEQGILFNSSWLSLKAGYAFDNVFDRKLQMQTHHLDAKDHKYTSRAQWGVLTLGFGDRVEFFSGLGSMRAALSQKIDNDKVHYHSDTHFAWSIGGRTLFAYWGNLQFGLNASYMHFFPPLPVISVDGITYPKDKNQLHYKEWQVGAGISYHFWWLFPYIGVKYSNVTAQFIDLRSLQFLFPKKDFTLENQKHYGLVVGCGLSPERGFAVNVEGRFIDETAFTVSADVKF